METENSHSRYECRNDPSDGDKGADGLFIGRRRCVASRSDRAARFFFGVGYFSFFRRNVFRNRDAARRRADIAVFADVRFLAFPEKVRIRRTACLLPVDDVSEGKS